MNLNPILRICLQHADGYYSLPFDATTGLVIIPGTGAVFAVHNGQPHSGTAANFTPPNPPEHYATLAALLQPVVVATPGDDLSALALTHAYIEVPPGHYPEFDVVEPT